MNKLSLLWKIAINSFKKDELNAVDKFIDAAFYSRKEKEEIKNLINKNYPLKKLVVDEETFEKLMINTLIKFFRKNTDTIQNGSFEQRNGIDLLSNIESVGTKYNSIDELTGMSLSEDLKNGI